MIRRAIGDRWPALSHWFGLRPWDVERLSWGELFDYLEALDGLPPIGRTVPVTLTRS